MREAGCWLAIERYENWLRDKSRGFNVIGFSKRYESTINKIKKGDKLVIYIASKRSVLSAIHEIISEKPYYSNELLWDEIYPIRMHIRPDIVLPEEKFIPIKEILEDLSFTRGKKDWRQCFRGPLRRISKHDYKIIRNTMIRS